MYGCLCVPVCVRVVTGGCVCVSVCVCGAGLGTTSPASCSCDSRMIRCKPGTAHSTIYISPRHTVLRRSHGRGVEHPGAAAARYRIDQKSGSSSWGIACSEGSRAYWIVHHWPPRSSSGRITCMVRMTCCGSNMGTRARGGRSVGAPGPTAAESRAATGGWARRHG
eukprot:COSAG01_NODE_25157_length_753_cov_8.941896_1_plen_166_part_00